jgi:flagellar secretion chaperone FliS
MTTSAMRERYLNDSISTASPAKLLVMLYDRLVLDLAQAEEALGAGDRTTAGTSLVHAQDIILELRTTLDTSAWEGGPGLANLYGFLVTELIAANVRGEAAKVVTIREIVEPLRDAWREAAVRVAADALASATR